MAIDPLKVTAKTKTAQTGGKWVTGTDPTYGGSSVAGTYSPFYRQKMVGTWFEPEFGQVQDTDAMAGQVAKNYLTMGNEQIAGMGETAQAGITAAQAGVTAANEARIQNSATSARIAQDAEAVRSAAPRLVNDANAQRGYAATFAGMGAGAQQQAVPWLTTGADILGMNAGAGGMAGEWVKNYNAMSPDSLVSFAASDAQRSIENTRSQMARTLSRSGVSPSSPAYIAALSEARKYEQALLAGVKTRARLLGLKEQSGALQQGMQMALGATGMGDQLTARAIAAYSAASSATGAASGAEATGAGIRAQAGGLEAQGAALATQGAQTTIAANQALTGANNSLLSAQQVAADYYSTQASSVLGMLQAGGSSTLAHLFS